MSLARNIVIQNLFELKNMPKLNRASCMFSLDLQDTLDASQVLIKELETYNNCISTSANSLFAIICNRDVFDLKICNRVYTNLWNLKPFLVYGRNGFYQQFVAQGYKTYKLIDYSFDSIEAPHKRLAALLEQVEKLTKYRNIELIQNALNKTTMHNFKVMMQQVDNEPIDNDTPIPKLNTLHKFRRLL